jgi:clan AA aspartic protease
MIRGVVNRHREALIPLIVRNRTGQEVQIEAIVDTGFNGSLTLPVATIASLSLPWRNHGQATLANGSVEIFDIYAAIVVWDGLPRHVLVEEAATDPLVGMALLDGYDLLVEVVDGGSVAIQKR